MIIKMSKIYVATSTDNRENLLHGLRSLGVVHVVPVNPEKAAPDAPLAAELANFEKAIILLENVEPSGNAPDIALEDAAAETVNIQRRSQELRNRMTNLHRQYEQAELWGDLDLSLLDELEKEGVIVGFYVLPESQVSDVHADCVTVLHEMPSKHVLLAVASKTAPELPEDAEQLERPKVDRPTLRSQAKQLDEQLTADAKRLADIAVLLPGMQKELARIRSHAQYVSIDNSAHCDSSIFAIQGWTPANNVPDVIAGLQEKGVPAAIHEMEPTEDDAPPTLLRHSWWVKPIVALFDILGTVPGYKEMDISPFFMLTMPIFTAMLVGDAGYGLIFTLVGLLTYKKLKSATGKPVAGQLIIIFGIATLIWGVLSANYFGMTPETFAKAGNFVTTDAAGVEVPDYTAMQNGSGAWASIGRAMMAPAMLWRSDDEAARNVVLKIRFILAVIHLGLAHLRKLVMYFPSQQFLAEFGWVLFVIGMFEVVWLMFFHGVPFGTMNLMYAFFIAGLAGIFLFSHPSKNPVKRLGLGIAVNLMPAISSLGDTLSYIRLMAVGLASYYIASAFNGLAMSIIHGMSGWLLPVGIILGVVILLAAHGLNIFLCIIAIFAHGVRLNLLEFSNNCGVEWAGHPFTPFSEPSNS